MNTQTDIVGEQLESAFVLFNQFSEKLASSYSDLENNVTRLTQELADTRNCRLNDLAEKEVLAAKLESLLDALPAGIIVLDKNDRITQTNPAARKMLAIESNKNIFIGESWNKVAQTTIKTDGTELRLKKGRWCGRWIHVSTCELGVDVDTVNPGKIVLISDITEIRVLQNKLNRQQRLSSLGEMVASLAHQIRTPLASALLYISTLNHPMTASDDRIRFAKKARERLHHLERLVNDMLVFARGDVAKSEFVNAYELMMKIKSVMSLDNRTESIQISLNNNLKDVLIQGNSDALLSVMQNLIDNAIEACVEAPDIDDSGININAFLNNDNQLEIIVADRGCGMTDAVKEKVLEPFYTTRSTGTGLGLSVVSELINRYGGELTIDSKVGEGSEFNIKLPRVEATALLPSNISQQYSKHENIIALTNCRASNNEEQEVVI